MFSCPATAQGAVDPAWLLETSQSRASSWSLVSQRKTMEKGIWAKGTACAGSFEVFQGLECGFKKGCTAREGTVAAPKVFSPDRSPEREAMAQKYRQIHG